MNPAETLVTRLRLEKPCEDANYAGRPVGADIAYMMDGSMMVWFDEPSQVSFRLRPEEVRQIKLFITVAEAVKAQVEEG